MNVPPGIHAMLATSGRTEGRDESGGATPREPDGGGRGGRFLPVPGVAARQSGGAEVFLGFMIGVLSAGEWRSPPATTVSPPSHAGHGIKPPEAPMSVDEALMLQSTVNCDSALRVAILDQRPMCILSSSLEERQSKRDPRSASRIAFGRTRLRVPRGRRRLRLPTSSPSPGRW